MCHSPAEPFSPDSDYGELVRRARKQSILNPDLDSYERLIPDPLCQELADAIEQRARENAVLKHGSRHLNNVCVRYDEEIANLKRELAACEGALRNSGNMVRDLNDLCKTTENERDTLRAELTRCGIPLPEEHKPCPWPVGDCPHPSACKCAERGLGMQERWDADE